MGTNIEIKARARDFERQRKRADALAAGSAEHLVQEDTFFTVPFGRLKLRRLGDGSAELIQYDRDDSREPKESRYVFYRTEDPEGLEEVLAKALGIRGIVLKRRTVYLVGQTRIHLDQVEGLGAFIELEVVLDPGQDIQYGTAVAEDLMSKLEIEKEDLIAEAYVDLLRSEIGCPSNLPKRSKV
jgi:predicted adenylyl cyclase CyaB